MIGVDTNILLRAVLDDHPAEAEIAKRFLKKLTDSKRLFISSYAILEMVWVLKVKKYSRAEIYDVVLMLLDTSGITIGQREVLVFALEMYIKGKADFGDYLILAESKSFEAPKVASFDKVFCKDKHAEHPKNFI